MAIGYTLTTPLSSEKLLFAKLVGKERLSEPFRFEYHVLGKNANIDFDKLLGQSITLVYEGGNSLKRYFNSVVTEASHVGSVREFQHFVFVGRPRLWLLTQTADCKIFQNKSIPVIIKEVLKDAGVEVKDSLTETYSQLDYCVQYRESNFDFISRLMEAYGIYYFFTHESGKHTMVLADSGSVHEKIEGTNEVRVQKAGAATREIEYFWDFRPATEVSSGTAILTDYNFETPKASLEVRSQHKASYDMEQGEVFDYPGKYDKADTGQPIAKVRIEELQAESSFSRGEGNVRGLTAGGLVSVSLSARSADQIEYLIVETNISLEAIDTLPPEVIASVSPQERLQNRFRVSFGAIPAATPFRPARKTKRPVIGGPHTALVVGKEGEEIWTDKYGRIRVQFYWDRLGKKDENSTCWVRVVQAWAGAQWGTIFLPRVGQEVMVQFLEGDPDRPVVTGCLYNADMMPPYALTANMTQSGIKTRSTKQGTAENFNELRFEDAKDKEEIYFHAEKDFNRVVENNDTLKVGFDKKDKGDQTIEIYNNRTVTLDQGSDKLEIKTGNRTVLIDKGDLELTITEGKRTTKVKGDDKLTVESGNHETTVSQGASKLTVSAGDHTVKVAAGKCTIEAAQSITLKVGGSSIEIKPTGITITSMQIDVKGSMGATIDGGLQLQAKGTMATFEGQAMNTIKGGIVMIN